MTGGRTRKETVLVGAILVLVLSLGVSFYRTFDAQMLREREFRENPLWLASQGERELQHLVYELNAYADGVGGVSSDDIQVQFDILWSRIDLMKDTNTGGLLARTPEGADAIKSATRLLRRLEPDVMALGPQGRKRAGELAIEFQALDKPMHAATVAVNVANWMHHARQRSRVRDELGLAVLLALGVILSGGVLLVVAVRETRASRRLAGQYEGAMRELTLARDELETRVSERTEALTAEVAERTRTETELRESEARYRLVVDSIPDALWIHTNGLIVFANQACAAMLGLENPEELLGRNALEFVHEDDLALARRRMTLAQSDGAAPPQEIRFLKADGTTVPVDASVIATTYAGEAALMSVMRDISERQQAQVRLRRSEIRLQQALEASGDGMWEWDIAAGTVERSRRNAEIIGLDPNRLKGSIPAWTERAHPDDRAKVERAIQACQDGDATTMSVEYRLRDKDGGWIWVLSQGTVVERDERGKPLRVVGTVRDMTDQRRTENALRALKEQAESANAAKSQFLANMSHELRTPLNAILGFTEAMRLELAGPIGNPVYAEYVQDIHNSGTHLLELISDLLDISAIEAGVFRLHEAVVDVPTLVSGCLRLLEQRAQVNGVRLVDLGFEGVGDGPPPALRVDERRTRQILLHAVSSGMRRTPPGGQVSLVVRLNADGSLSFVVTDDGAALSATEIAHGLDMQGTRMGEPVAAPDGPGLGLPLSRTLVEAHGGTLSLHAERGRGNVLSVCFPSDRVLRRDGRQGAALRLV